CRGPCRRPHLGAGRESRTRSGRVNVSARQVAEAFIASCRDELDAPKPGNVHVLSPAGRKTPEDFVRSAQVAAGPLSVAGARVGRRIFGAVEATRAAVGRNTNLGIILLGAPLAATAEDRASVPLASAARLWSETDG